MNFLFESVESKLEKYCKGRNNDSENNEDNINNDVKKLRKLLMNNSKNINVNNITYDGWSPLHLACASGRLHIVECLFHDGKADANIKSIHELMTPLHVSCWNGHIHIVKYLIEKEEARIVDTSEFGYTSLHYAAKNGQEIICKYLCHKGIDINAVNDEDQSALLLAAKHGHIEVVKHLISIPHIQINRPDLQFCTPIHHACWEGHINIMKVLLDANAAVTLKDIYDRTPSDVCKTPDMKIIMKSYIDSAISNAQTKITESGVIEYVAATEDYLLEQCWDLCTINENINENNKILYDDNEEFQTFLQLLSVHPHLKIGYLKYKNSKTLLMEAAQNGKITVCKLLLTEGADPMNADINGFTALHFASTNGHLKIVKLFLSKCNMNPEVCNKMNRTALHCAAQNGNIEIIKLMIDYGVNIRAKDKNGYNALHFASFHNHAELVDYLIFNTDLEVHETTNSLETALDLTSSKLIQAKLKSIMDPGVPVAKEVKSKSPISTIVGTQKGLINASSLKRNSLSSSAVDNQKGLFNATSLKRTSISSSSAPISTTIDSRKGLFNATSLKRTSISSSSASTPALNNSKTVGINLANTIQGQRKQPLTGLAKRPSIIAAASNPPSTFREKLKQLRNQQQNK